MTSQPKRWLLAAALLVAAALAVACGSQALPTPTPTRPLPTATPTPDAWQRAQQAGRLVVGVAADYPPFQYYDENFRLAGFDIDLMQAIGQRLGVAIEFNDFAFDGLGPALVLGQLDVAIAAISVTPERQQLVDFSNVYYVGEDAVLVPADSPVRIASSQDLANLRVAVQRGSVYETYVRQTLVAPGLLPEGNLLLYADIEQAVTDLRRGLADAAMLDLVPAQRFAGQGGVRIAAQGFNRQRLAIALPKGETALRRAINDALAALQAEGLVARLAAQHLALDPGEVLPVPPPEPEPTPIPDLPTPTPAPPAACLDGMAWVADLSFDDQAMNAPPLLAPGQRFVKGWRVRNAGTCTWDSRYFLDFVRGNVPAAQMGGQRVFVQGTVPPNGLYDFYVELTAPTTPGGYQGFWQMANAQGVRFGETVWVGIRVPAAPTPTPVPTLPPAPGINFTVDRTAIRAGECVAFAWNVVNVQAVYFHSEFQRWEDGGVAGQASRTECPAVTTTYFLRVVGRDGSVQVRQITVTVTPAANAPVIARFLANPPGPIALGQCVNLDWAVQGEVSRVTLSRGGVVLWDSAPVSGTLQECPPVGVHTYQLAASGPGGTSQGVVTLVVNAPTAAPPPPPPPPTPTPAPPQQPQITAFYADPPQVQVGQCTNLVWNTGGGTRSVRLTRGGTVILDNGPVVGNWQECPTQVGRLVYRLEARGDATTVYQDVTVDVQPAGPALMGFWTLAQLDGQPPLAGTRLTINFGTDGRLSGNAGCNDYSGSFTADVGGRLTVGGLSATGRLCEAAVNEQEQRYLALLRGAVRFQLSGPTLTLYDGSGRPVLAYTGAR